MVPSRSYCTMFLDKSQKPFSEKVGWKFSRIFAFVLSARRDQSDSRWRSSTTSRLEHREQRSNRPNQRRSGLTGRLCLHKNHKRVNSRVERRPASARSGMRNAWPASQRTSSEPQRVRKVWNRLGTFVAWGTSVSRQLPPSSSRTSLTRERS